MKIIVIPDSYKGSMTSNEVCKHIEIGIQKVLKDCTIISIPIADGGEGTVDALLGVKNGRKVNTTVLNPLGAEITASFGVYENKAIIEMAAASGITLISKEELNPLNTTSYGTGQLIKAALDEGIRKIIIGIGGSATNDGGMGMAQALGVSFKDKQGAEVGFGGKETERVVAIDTTKIDKRIFECEITVASDVQNTICGEHGASYIYGPQKGACPQTVKQLDDNLYSLAKVIKKNCGIDVLNLKGGGAAGGLGAALVAFCGATLKSGIEIMLNEVKLTDHLKDTDLVLTGEGKIDGQSTNGKVPVGVAKIVKSYKDIPVIAIVGDIGKDAHKVYDFGIDSIMSNVNKAMCLDEAIKNSPQLLEDCTERLMRMLIAGKKFFYKSL